MKLIQAKDYLLLVDGGAEIVEGDYYYWKFIGKVIRHKLFEGDIRLGRKHPKGDVYKTIAYYPLTKEDKPLDLPWLPNPFKEEIELLSYINKLANQRFNGWTNDEMKGYKTALISVSEFYKKTQPKQFTLEDVLNFLDLHTDAAPTAYLKSELVKHLKSLSAQQLPIEFIPEEKTIEDIQKELGIYGHDEGLSNREYLEYLKTNSLYKSITNSEGKNELCGTYKYEL